MRFNKYVGIDYSGAATPTTRSATLQIFMATQERGPQRICPSQRIRSRAKNWNRVELANWLLETLNDDEPTLVAIDHGLSVPGSYFDRYNISSWDEFLVDFARHWPTTRTDSTVEQFRQGNRRTGQSSELRLTERWTAGAKSVFQFDVQGSVANSTHAGLPFMLELRRAHPRLHFWPFDGWSPTDGVSVVAETFPSLFRNRYPRDERTVDQQDAYSVCKWLSEADATDRFNQYFSPPLSARQRSLVEREGWILGVY